MQLYWLNKHKIQAVCFLVFLLTFFQKVEAIECKLSEGAQEEHLTSFENLLNQKAFFNDIYVNKKGNIAFNE